LHWIAHDEELLEATPLSWCKWDKTIYRWLHSFVLKRDSVFSSSFRPSSGVVGVLVIVLGLMYLWKENREVDLRFNYVIGDVIELTKQ
jgi:hypothetical protein